MLSKKIKFFARLFVFFSFAAFAQEKTPNLNSAQNETDASTTTDAPAAKTQTDVSSANKKTKGVFTLGRVVVSATRDSQIAQEVETKIDERRLQQSDSKRITDIARSQLGVTLEKGGARNETMLHVRGFDLRQVPLFIDGIPVYVPYDGYVDLGRFSALDISEIHIAKGYSSPMYGPNTLGGAINLVSKRPYNKVEANGGYGINFGKDKNTFGNEAYLNLGFNFGKFYVQTNGSFMAQDGWQLAKSFSAANSKEDGHARDYSESRDMRFGLKVGITPNETDEYVFGAATQKGSKGTPLYTGEDSAPNRIRYWTWPKWDKDSVYFLSNSRIKEGYIKTKLYYDTFINHLRMFDDATFSKQTGKSDNSYYNDYSVGLGFEGGYNIAQMNFIKAGFQFKDDVHREHSENAPALQPGPTQRFEERTYSLALEDTHTFSDYTKIAVGVDYSRREMVQAQELVAGNISEMELAASNAVNGQFGIFQSVDTQDQFYFTIAKKTRFATIKDRYSYRFGQALPNPQLKPEYAYHFELGYTRTMLDKLQFDFAIFHSEVRDKIQRVDNVNGTKWQNQNIGKVIYRGVEIGLSGFAHKNLELGFNYAYLWWKNVSNPKIYITDNPAHKFYAFLDWQMVRGLFFTFRQNVESGRVSSSDNKYVTKPFATTDIKFAYNISKSFSLDFGVTNLFDANYAYSEGYPEAGRTFTMNAKFFH